MNRSGYRNAPWTLAITGLGALLGLGLIVEGYLIVARIYPPPAGYRIGVASSLPFIAALMFGGYRLETSQLSGERYERVAIWCLGSCLGLVVFVTAVTLVSRPVTALLVGGTVRWSASVGGGVGFLIGLFEARAIEQAIVSEQLRNRQRRTQRERDRLEEFASVVSHDLRSPLNVARGRLELAREECDSDHLDAVDHAHDRMGALVEDLLSLARVGERTDALEAIVLADVAEDCWQNVAATEATLVVATDRTIQADGSRLRQLLENLFRNAVEHGSTSPDSQARQDAVEHGSTSPPSTSSREDAAGASSGEPSVADAPEDAVEHGGDDVTITVGDLDDGFFVADEGPGIPAAERSQVFEMGYTTRADGTGFGLAIVKEVVEAHDWEIRVTESADGGARFEITGVEFDR